MPREWVPSSRPCRWAEPLSVLRGQNGEPLPHRRPGQAPALLRGFTDLDAFQGATPGQVNGTGKRLVTEDQPRLETCWGESMSTRGGGGGGGRRSASSHPWPHLVQAQPSRDFNSEPTFRPPNSPSRPPAPDPPLILPNPLNLCHDPGAGHSSAPRSEAGPVQLCGAGRIRSIYR